MEEQKKTTLDYWMYYGALLGLFWIVKYLFFIGEAYWVHFIYFYHLLNVVSPLLMYVFYLRYKMETPELKHGIWRCVLFVVAICFFGSLFESVIIFAHYAFINPDAYNNINAQIVGVIEAVPLEDSFPAEQVEPVKQLYIKIFSSKIMFLLMNMMSQILIGFVFSLLIGFLTRVQKNN